MLNRFKEFLVNDCKFALKQLVLVALSGGADSIVLLHLLNQLGIRMVAAHCNFNLRGEESDGDERFVVEETTRLQVSLFQKSFDTKAYAKDNGISIEMAARELRYNWFNEIIASENLDVLATGHHKDDSVETFFLNLVRGTGIKGLSGIKPVANNIIRPLLCLTRSEIETYCDDNKLAYRTDSSNHETVYVRNKIRNQILPLFKELNASFSETMEGNMHRLKQLNNYLSSSVAKIKDEIVVEQDGKMLISLKHVAALVDKELILFELLQPKGFNGAVVKEIVYAIDQDISGKQFFSSDYRLIKDRFNLILLPIEQEDLGKQFFISVDDKVIEEPMRMQIDNDIIAESYLIEKVVSVGQFDADLLEFPLVLKRWEQGDHFKPLGMRHFKKLSDYFIDAKFSIKDKEDAWLLCSGGHIIWIVGSRTDDRFKITSKTKRVSKFTLLS